MKNWILQKEIIMIISPKMNPLEKIIMAMVEIEFLEKKNMVIAQKFNPLEKIIIVIGENWISSKKQCDGRRSKTEFFVKTK